MLYLKFKKNAFTFFKLILIFSIFSLPTSKTLSIATNKGKF